MRKTLEQLQEELNRLYQLNDRGTMETFFMDEILNYAPDCCSVDNEYIFLMNEAGSYYRGISQYGEAVSCFQGLMETMKRFHLEHTSGFATVLNNLAGCYRMTGNYSKAEELFHQAIALYETVDAQETMEYASALNNLSLCYQAARQYDQAMKYQKLALACSESIAERPESLAASYTNYASLCYTTGQKDTAFSAIDKAFACLENSGCTHTPAYIGALHVQAYLNGQEGHLEQALTQYKRVLDLTERMFGRNSDYSAAAKNAGIICCRLGASAQAVAYLTESLRIDRQIFPADHPRIAASEALLEHCRKDVCHE